MATGFAVPVGVGPTGGTLLVDGDEQADKIIRLTLADDESEHAFQESLGLQEYIFELPGAQRRGIIQVKLRERFAAFERLRLFRLKAETIAWSSGAEGEEILSFEYINLESDEVRSFSREFRA